MQVVEGEGNVHAPGSRSSRPLTVEVTDETGRPVEGAAVSFHTPVDGPSALFPSGLRTEVVRTDVRGRASVRGLQVNSIPGRFLIRIVAAKEQVRVGALSSQYIADSKSNAPAAGAGHRKRTWVIAIAVVAAGAATSYLYITRPATPPQPLEPRISVGPPEITIGRP